MKYRLKHKYNAGDIIKDKKRNMELLEQIRMPAGKSNKYVNLTKRGYKYHCLNCNNIDVICEYNIDKGNGCSVCSNSKVVKGINDISTTNPELVKYFVHSNDVYKYSYLSGKEVLMKCPNCGFKKVTIISTLYSQGFSCKKCGDKVSFPQKIMLNLLNQLNIEFETEKTFLWSQNKKFDFYIRTNNCIIEMHGLQHYKGGFEKLGGRSLKEEKENDTLKEKIAKENYIKDYIIINCSKSELNFIKNNILNSKLSKLFNLSNIDWLKCYEYACNSLIKVACDLWNSGIEKTSEISKIMKVSNCTVISYLKKGKILNWTNYDPDVSRHKPRLECRKENGSSARKVVCVNTGEIFNCIDNAIEYYKSKGINVGHIGECCSNKRKSCGKLPNGEKLKWMYYEDFINKNK